MEQSQNNTAKPPYLSVARLRRLIELLSTMSLTELSIKYLQVKGLPGTDANVGLAALRFMGLVDENGKVLETAKFFHLRGEQRQKEFQMVLKTAYKKLFDVAQEPYNLPKDDLSNEFVVRYSITSRLAQTAVVAFLYLCEEAGLKEATTKIPKQRSGAEKKVLSKQKQVQPKKATGEIEKVGENKNMKSFPLLGGKVYISLPDNAQITEVLMSNEFKTVADAINKLGETFFVNDEEKTTSESERDDE